VPRVGDEPSNEQRVVRSSGLANGWPKEDTAADRSTRVEALDRVDKIARDKRASVGQPFISARLAAGVDFYFLAFFAFFFFTIVSSFCSDGGLFRADKRA
jgi:hypothetical protein